MTWCCWTLLHPLSAATAAASIAPPRN